MTSLNDFEREFLINRDISTPTIFDYVSLICAGYAILRYKTTEEIKLVFSDDSCVVVIITLILRLMFGILFTSKDNFKYWPKVIRSWYVCCLCIQSFGRLEYGVVIKNNILNGFVLFCLKKNSEKKNKNKKLKKKPKKTPILINFSEMKSKNYLINNCNVQRETLFIVKLKLKIKILYNCLKLFLNLKGLGGKIHFLRTKFVIVRILKK